MAKKLIILMFALVFCTMSLILLPSLIVWGASHNKSFDSIEDCPTATAGVVLGTTAKVAGRDNIYFTNRMQAAAKLFHSKKVKCLIVSGDNRSIYYNEPKQMAEALTKLGVPKEKIVLDYAGLRTLDSVFRAQKVFGLNDAIFVSQAFHNHRALFIADHIGLKSTGYNAENVPLSMSIKVQIREVLARIKMLLDLNIFHTQPKFLGELETLPI